MPSSSSGAPVRERLVKAMRPRRFRNLIRLSERTLERVTPATLWMSMPSPLIRLTFKLLTFSANSQFSAGASGRMFRLRTISPMSQSRIEALEMLILREAR